MTNRAAENLALLDAETQRLLETCAQLTDADRPSLCEGWSIAHVLSHVARNADGLVNMVLTAVDGQERAVYASNQRRDADIEEGAQRPLPEIIADVEETAARFREQAQALIGPAGDRLVKTRTGNTVAGHQVVAMRLLEGVFHHVDLDAGFTFDDADPGWVARTLRRGVSQWEATDDAPPLTLCPEGMPPLELAGGGPEVSGTAGQLLLWLSRGRVNGLTLGRAEGLSSTADLPQPPPWA